MLGPLTGLESWFCVFLRGVIASQVVSRAVTRVRCSTSLADEGGHFGQACGFGILACCSTRFKLPCVEGGISSTLIRQYLKTEGRYRCLTPQKFVESDRIIMDTNKLPVIALEFGSFGVLDEL